MIFKRSAPSLFHTHDGVLRAMRKWRSFQNQCIPSLTRVTGPWKASREDFIRSIAIKVMSDVLVPEERKRNGWHYKDDSSVLEIDSLVYPSGTHYWINKEDVPSSCYYEWLDNMQRVWPVKETAG